jgi:hypothetical protein
MAGKVGGSDLAEMDAEIAAPSNSEALAAPEVLF